MLGCLLHRGRLTLGKAKRIRLTQQSCHRRNFSTKDGMRVAIVGGGPAGMACALHLSPLVESGLIAGPIDVFESSSEMKRREIGVGIWNTAIEPFKASERSSHQHVWNELTTRGNWIGEVGYRTPRGDWLVKSSLPTENITSEDPALLFLPEADFLESLRKAILIEEGKGTIMLHHNSRIEALHEESLHAWSSQLILGEQDRPTERDYHLVVAADGLNSALRKAYGGHLSGNGGFLGATLPGLRSKQKVEVTTWQNERSLEVTSLQDRNYTVYRGNAPLSNAEAGTNGMSFQTWGEGRSMRFASVPMTSEGEQIQVWFATIDDSRIDSEQDTSKRRELLTEAFADWHEPVSQMISATPAESIMMERAMAHKHCVSPILNITTTLKLSGKSNASTFGYGPAVVFVGDAFMTVDPILAQGFSFAMEGAAALSESLLKCDDSFQEDQSLAFNPYTIRKELQHRHDRRLHRLISLLRATELVQAFGQPSGGTFSGFFSKEIARPCMQVIPNGVKSSIFNTVMKYSLGMIGKN